MSNTTIPLTLSPVRPQITIPEDLPRPAADGSRTLADTYGRVARDLRVSLTDRCNLRCTYCMPAEGLDWLPKDKVLTDEEITRLITLGVEKLGIRQVRFTGGEPLMRRSLEKIITHTKSLKTDEGQAPQTAITTNGLGLAKRAQKLADAGLDRVNISLDTIDKKAYAKLTRRDRLDDVIDAIETSLEVGLQPVKINAVIMPGFNDQDIVKLARFCLEKGTQLRFIEQMPLGPPSQWDRSEMVTAEDILDELRTQFELTPVDKPRGSAPAALWKADDGHGLRGEIGVIASVTHSFCGDCDRTRLTADGAIRNCLFASADQEFSVRDKLRDGSSDDEIATVWAAAMWAKLPGHAINDPGFLQPDRPMAAIGG